MGLDITLGVLVLLAGIRGWLKGFLLQAIQLGAIVGCVFLADPLRDLAKPYAHDYLPAVRPELLDKLLWWAAAVVSYLLLSGVPTSLVRLARKRPREEGESRWGDSGAGFLLGLAKGAVYTSFVVWGIEVHAVPRYTREGGWVAEQLKASRALPLARAHRPAEVMWKSQPVQTFMRRILDRGLWTAEEPSSPIPAEPPALNARGDAAAVPAAVPRPRSQPKPPLVVPRPPRLDPNAPSFLDDLDAALRREGLDKSR